MKKITITFLAVTICSLLFAQIPNGGFESWSNGAGYNVPDSWDNMNPLTNSMSMYTCMKGTPGAAGHAYLKLVSTAVTGMGVVPGVATCGTFDMSNMSAPTPKAGFAFTQRPQTLDGKWQYMASGSDGGFITVLLTKWNNAMMMRDTVAYTLLMTHSMQMSWSNFSIPVTYISQEYPDTAMILLSASGTTPEDGSYLYVDTLHFTGSVAGTTGIKNEAQTIHDMNVFPNPATNHLAVTFNTTATTHMQIQLVDISGRVVFEKAEDAAQGNNMLNINVSGYSKGIYFLTLRSENTTQVKKIVIE